MVKEGEVEAALRLFHQVPAKLRNADDIAPQLTDIVQVLLQQVGGPLLGIVIYAKKHYSFTFFAFSCAEISSMRLLSSL